MNNKGQTLVMFILVLPLLLIILCLTIDVGLLSLEKKKIENTVKSAMKYELNSTETNTEVSKNRLIKTITKSINDIKIKTVEITNDNIIVVSISKEYKGIFSKILKNSIFDIDLTFKGFKNGTDIIIKKEW